MASQNDLVNRLIVLVRGLDDAAWEALASRGLLRRARKELEAGLAVTISAVTETTVTLLASPFEVSMTAAGPARATCTCPAAGVCQHILAAGLFLQNRYTAPESAPPALSAESIRQEIALYSSDRLRDWAGSAEYRAGLVLLEKNSLPTIIEWTDSVLIRLMPSGIEARFVPNAGLDGMIVPSVRGRRIAVAAMLALRDTLGFERPQVLHQQSLIELTGAPRTNAEILASAQSVMQEAVKVGLCHLSPGFAARLTTLAISAQGANLPRISLALKTLADEARAIAEREAQADESRLLLSLARCWALADAIRQGKDATDPALVGVTRLQYVDVPAMELCGIGAYPWQTRSGYRGLTLLFWSSKNREILTWSEARPVGQQFDPRQRFFADGPWDGAQSPSQVASSNIILRGARRTASGRISGSSKTTVVVTGSSPLSQIDFGERCFASWSELYTRSLAAQPIGLRDSNPLDRIAILEPVFAGKKAFDNVTQTFLWEIYDEKENLLTLSLPFEDLSKQTIHKLETLNLPDGTQWKILVNLNVGDRGLSAVPISILDGANTQSPVFHLAFDVLPNQPKQYRESKPEEEQENQVDETLGEDEMQIASAALRGFLTGGERQLVSVAEAGTDSGRVENLTSLKSLASDAHRAGLTTLATVLRRIADPDSAARSVIQARYLINLYGTASSRVS